MRAGELGLRHEPDSGPGIGQRIAREVPVLERPGIVQLRLLLLGRDLEDGETAVATDEVVVVDGEPAGVVTDVLVEQLVCLSCVDARGASA